MATLVTDVVKPAPEMIPIAFALFGIGMTAGNVDGSTLAGLHPARGNNLPHVISDHAASLR